MKQENEKIAVCWSGGKDCCLALYKLLMEGREITCLFSMVSSQHARNHAHGIPNYILEMQAEALGIPLILVDSAGDYEQSFKRGLSFLEETYGVNTIAFGNLYVEDDRKWNEEKTMEAGLKPIFPVWITEDQTSEHLIILLSLGFQMVVCRAKDEYFDREWVGKIIDNQFYEEIHQKNICVMGEYGEYHTFVIDGPIFRKRLTITKSEVMLQSGLWSLDIREAEWGESVVKE